MIVAGDRLRKDGTVGKREDSVSLVPYEVEWRLLDPTRDAEARKAKYGDAQWYEPASILTYDMPEEVLKVAAEGFIETCRMLLFGKDGVFPDGLPITVVELADGRWRSDWADWLSADGLHWDMGKGVLVTASLLGYAVGNQHEQAAVLLAAGLHQIAKDANTRWCRDAWMRARGMVVAIATTYPDLRHPYHTATSRMMPESSADEAFEKNSYEPLGRRFTEDDLIQSVVRDVVKTFGKFSPVFYIDPWIKRESREQGGRRQLIGRTRL